jgi:CheY-like chemotaxis protein
MDDEEPIRDLLVRIMTHCGYEAETARDGAETIALYKQAKDAGRPFEAVIMDLTIPGGMGGKDTIAKLIEIDSQVKAIVSSGYAHDPVMANYKQYGFRGVVAKPYKITELSEVLETVILGRAQ